MTSDTTSERSLVWVRFLTAGLFLCSPLSLIMACNKQKAVSANRSIVWEEYDSAAVDAHVASGENVFVFMHPELSPESPMALDAVSSTQLAALCPNGRYATYLLKYDDWNDSNVRRIARTIGFTKEPYIVFYPTDGNPQALDPQSLRKLGQTS